MLQLLEALESVIRARRHVGDGGKSDVLPWDLDDDAELSASMSSLNARFHEIVPNTLRLMWMCIRNHPGEFVLIED
jgi:hypothetical protein